jgi:hypothetical protein
MSKSLLSLAALASLLAATAWLGTPSAASARTSATPQVKATARSCCDSLCPLCEQDEQGPITLDCCAGAASTSKSAGKADCPPCPFCP